MISKRKLLKLEDAAAGMALASAVLDDRGNVLLPLAATLTDATLKALRRRGVETIHVENHDISEADLEAERGRREQRIGYLFRKSGTDPASRFLLQQITQYRLGELE